MSDEPNWLDELRNSDFGKAIRAQCDEQEDVDGQREGPDWKGSIYGACPLQGHGTVDDRFWYFRSRSDEWRFEVYTKPCDDALPGDDALVWDRYGSYMGDAHNAGWMKYSEGWTIIEMHIAAYRASTSAPSQEKP